MKTTLKSFATLAANATVASRLVAAGAFFALVAAAPSANAANTKTKQAGPQGRICVQYRGGGESCGFSTMAQCQQALSGNGGMCLVLADLPRPAKLAPVTPLSQRDEDDTED